MSEVYDNQDFISDLSDRGRAVRSVVYAAGIATLWVFEFSVGGHVHDSLHRYPAEQVPASRLKDKFRKLEA